MDSAPAGSSRRMKRDVVEVVFSALLFIIIHFGGGLAEIADVAAPIAPSYQ